MRQVSSYPALVFASIITAMTGCGNMTSTVSRAPAAMESGTAAETAFTAQVVGVQWLNPLQRRDYSIEWQLLWTLGLAKPNANDDLVKSKPGKFTTLQVIGSVAAGNDGHETFKGYHHKYINALIYPFHDIYFSSSRYFYNAHSLKDRTTWRELAGIHVEYALPIGKLDSTEAATYVQDRIIDAFNIGNEHFPTTWSRATPPDVRVTTGGPNAGFASLAAALDYLQAHPDETVWAMNWDAPSRPKDKQLNENMVLLVLAGPNYKTGRDPLAWIGYPASQAASDFKRSPNQPSQISQAWKATLAKAIHHGNKQPSDIGYVIHDANSLTASSPERVVNLANSVTQEIAGFDFAKQSFNTPALLGEMGAGTALTNVALAIAYANHIGKNVLVAGTTELDKPTAVVVLPPAKVRPIDHDKPWFRARGEATAYLMWWGLRHDHGPYTQGYSR